MGIRQRWGIGRKGLSVQFGNEYVKAVFAVLLACFRIWVHSKYSSKMNSDLYSIHVKNVHLSYSIKVSTITAMNHPLAP
jgi:hypothetical protein